MGTEPLDPQAKLEQAAGAHCSVIRYSGMWSARSHSEHLKKMQRAMAAVGLRATGTPDHSRHAAPFVPCSIGRKELWLKPD